MAAEATAKTPRKSATGLWTPSFIVLCLTVLLGYAHHALLVPTIPLYITDQGGFDTSADAKSTGRLVRIDTGVEGMPLFRGAIAVR